MEAQKVADYERLFIAFENTFISLLLFLSSGAIILGILRQGESVAGTTWIRTLWAGIYVVALGMTLVRRGGITEIVRAIWADKALLVLVVFVSLSWIWATDEILTARRVIIFLASTYLGLYIGARRPIGEIVRLTAIALVAAGILSLLAVLLLPEFGLYYDLRGVAWQGVFGNKNIMGRGTSLGAIMALILALDGKTRNQWIWWVGFGLLAVLTVLSEARASQAYLVLAVILVPALPVFRVPPMLVIPGGAVILVLLLVIGWMTVYYSEFLLELLGRNVTLSGRVGIWAAAVQLIEQRPLLGYGYGADFLSELGDLRYLMERLFDEWQPTHAHNGPLHMAFEVGFAGLALFVAHVFAFIKRGIQAVRASDGYRLMGPLFFLGAVLTVSVTQSVFISRNNIYWVLYVAFAAALCLRLDDGNSGKRTNRSIGNTTSQ